MQLALDVGGIRSAMSAIKENPWQREAERMQMELEKLEKEANDCDDLSMKMRYMKAMNAVRTQRDIFLVRSGEYATNNMLGGADGVVGLGLIVVGAACGSLSVAR